MKNNIEYDPSRPLRRLEKGDKATITVFCPVGPRNAPYQYSDISNGIYEATVTDDYTLECEKEPRLSGHYCYWYGNKWGCHGIWADEQKKLS